MSDISLPTRKRSNSIIPVEFLNDTSDGGMERAALAAVFGVREYTESKIFWNVEEDSIGHYIEEQHNQDTTTTTSYKQAQQQQQQSSSSYTTHRHVSPLTQSKVLPIIPVVSEFDDFWSEVGQNSKQSINTTTKTTHGFNFMEIPTPKDLSNSPPSLFDLIQSNENSNLILWGIIHKNNTIPSTAPSQDTSTIEKKKKSRWSAQQLIPKIIKKKASLQHISSSSAASVCSLVSTPAEESRVIEAATIEKLVEKLTISLGKKKKKKRS